MFALVKDIAGQRFGRLTVISPAGRKHRSITWNCVCDCGTTAVVVGTSLRTGDTQSCGCLHREVVAELGKTTNKTHGLSFSPTYYSWKSMIQRCNNPRHSAYKRYGAVGITICERWHNFDNFMADMGTRPSGKTLDRVDTYGGYEPSNCRWATKKEQANNRRKGLRLTLNGVTKTLHAWADEYCIPYGLLWRRLNQCHWPLNKALTEPLRITSLTRH